MDGQTIVERLEALEVGARSDLMKAAKRGQVTELRCQMEVCLYPDPHPDHFPKPNPDHAGRIKFDPRTKPLGPWEPSADHFPRLKKDGGREVRLGHRLCNRVDWTLNPASVPEWVVQSPRLCAGRFAAPLTSG